MFLITPSRITLLKNLENLLLELARFLFQSSRRDNTTFAAHAVEFRIASDPCAKKRRVALAEYHMEPAKMPRMRYRL